MRIVPTEYPRARWLPSSCVLPSPAERIGKPADTAEMARLTTPALAADPQSGMASVMEKAVVIFEEGYVSDSDEPDKAELGIGMMDSSDLNAL